MLCLECSRGLPRILPLLARNEINGVALGVLQGIRYSGNDLTNPPALPQALYCKYLDAVEQARESGCSCCNTVQPSCDMTIVTADDDGLKDLLKPLVPVEFPPDAILPEGLLQQFNLGGDVADFLLSPHGVEEKDDAGVATAVRLCKTCYKSSANGLLPQRALANGLASDAYVPPELADLSEAEVRLISMYTPGAKMVCVTPHGGRQTLYSSSFTVINNFEQLVKKVVFPGYRRQFLRGLCGV